MAPGQEDVMTAVELSTPRTVDQKVFRDVVGRFTSGVTIVTTAVDGRRFGTTASAMSSLSMEPPMLLICLNKSSETGAAVLDSGRFAVNILAEAQEHLAGQFAVKGQDKFSGVGVRDGITGSPLIQGTLATLECRTVETVTGGTHTVFLAEVVAAAGSELEPLTYFRGAFGRLERAKEAEAYRLLRDWVLTRRVPTGQTLEPAELMDSLQIDTEHLSRALVKLSSENLVTRRDDGGFELTPITAVVTDGLFDARCAIEVGIADAQVDCIADAQIAVLEGIADRLERIVNETMPDISRFLEASHQYHAEFVGLGGCVELVEAFSRLGISGVWRNAIADLDWWNLFDVRHHQELTEALKERSSRRAKQLIYEHNDQVKQMVRRIIADHGGQI
jgi:flavin reductase (DIM6/NTAB) family NADH-FMN oxidoreductase RutF